MQHCMTGYYVIIDYAAAYWWKRAEYLLNMPQPSDEDDKAALGAVHGLAQVLRATKREMSVGESTSTTEPDDHLQVEKDLHRLQVVEDPRDWEDAFPVEHLIRPFRGCIEQMIH